MDKPGKDEEHSLQSHAESLIDVVCGLLPGLILSLVAGTIALTLLTHYP